MLKIFETVQQEEKFQFGDTVYKSTYAKLIPIKIGKLRKDIKVSIVDGNVPFLLAREQLENWGAVIDFGRKTIALKETDEEFKMLDNGQHLGIKLAKDLEDDKEEFIKAVYKIRKMKTKQYAELKKLHRVYGHPTADRLCDLLKGAGEFDHSVKKKLEKIFTNCRICKNYRKKSKRSTVSFPKANDLNECVSVDLKPVATITGNALDKRHIVYMVDEASRYTKGGISKSKEAEDVVEVMINEWCLGFMGYPKKCFKADHGTEFDNKTLGALSKKLNIRIKLGPGKMACVNADIL